LFAFATSEGARIWDARSGAELRSWRLPQGLQQHLWFDTAGHLFLFQWERPAPEKPGECVVRELSRTNYLEPLYPPLHLFDGRIFHSSVAADGRFLVVCGARFTNSFETHVLDVVDSQNGQSLCSLPDPFRGDSDNFCLDASGRLVLCGAAEGHGCEIYEVPSARPAYRFDETISWISRGAEWCASGWDKIRGMPEVRIWRRDRPQQWVVLRGGFWEPSTAEFSPDGQRIAWGSADGTVYVAAMADVFGRLEQLGLGWR
jgi:WD40 repeat protein